MSRTGLVYSPRYVEHETGPFHPERADRLRAILERLKSTGQLDRLESIEPQPAPVSLVERVHARAYIDSVRAACQAGAAMMDTPDCPISPATYEVALLAAGGVVQAVDAVLAGRVRNAFCAVRPPGHHAEHNEAMGFCFFNNVAIAAEHLRSQHGLDRVAILDWDVHHGNGTQHHFEADPHVLFCSIHQDPRTLYPGTGHTWEQGRGPGEGTTLNVPMPPGSGDEDYRQAFEHQILPRMRQFGPEFMLISADFDAHAADPLAGIRLTTQMFTWMTREVLDLAESVCQGRVVSTLEGGYDLQALADCVQLHLEALEAGRV